MARSFADFPASAVERPQGKAFALTSYDWPLTTDIGVNGHRLDATIVDTGTPFTLLSPADAATCGVYVLTDTVEVATLFGLVSASTGYVDDLTIGGIHLRHVCVLVRHDDGMPSGHPLSNILGLNELRRTGHVEFLADRIHFPPPGDCDEPARPNCFIMEQGLRFFASHQGQAHLFSFDTGTATQVLSTAVFPVATTDTTHFTLDFEAQSVRLPYTVLASGKAPDYDGLLGIGFVRGFTRFSIHFGTMRMEGQQTTSRPHRHPTVADWFNRQDGFGLERNAVSLSLLQTPRDQELTRLLVLVGKNQPDSIIALTDRQLSQKDYNASVRLGFLKQKELALEDLGRYAEASAVVDSIIRLRIHSRKLTEETRAKKNYLKALHHVPAPELTMTGPVILPRQTDGKYAVTLNGTRGEATITPDHFITTMSEKEARKKGVRILLKHHPAGSSILKVGLIDSLRAGNATMRNLVVYLVKDKDAPLSLGMDFLRHVGEAEFTATALTLSSTGSLAEDVVSQPVRMANGIPLMQKPADSLPPYDNPGLRTQAGSPSPEIFIRQTGRLTLDFEHMRLR